MMQKKYWSRKARSITPYVPGEQPGISGLIKLNTNENPYPPSPKVIAAIQDAANAKLRLYPDPESVALREAIAKANGVSASQVFAGNGSDEVLALAFLAFFDTGRAITLCDIGYSFYPVYASLFGFKTNIIPLNDDFTIPVQSFFHCEGGVIFANPNAPTSLALTREEVRQICQNNDAPVLVDEAYVAFGAQSAVPLLREPGCDNLLIIRTFSKSHSLAGLRVGYAIGSADLIGALHAVKNSFNSYPLDRIAQAAAAASVLDEDYTARVVGKVTATREEARRRLKGLGFSCLDSSANFVFVKHSAHSAKKLVQELRERAVLVRHFDLPRIGNYLRISIGTDEEMERLYYALACILNGE